MIIIIRALPKKRERPKKRKAQKKKRKAKEKKGPKKGQCYYLFFHTCASKQHHVLHIVSLIYCASKQHHVFHIESLICCHFRILLGIFYYRTWLVYSYDGLPQNALGLREQASWMHTHQFSFVEHSFIALVHPLHGNPYSSC